MTEQWEPQAGDLVEIPGGTWHLLYQHGESMSGEPWFQVTDQFALGTAANPSRFVKLLCRAGDMATCWAEMAKLPGASQYDATPHLEAFVAVPLESCALYIGASGISWDAESHPDRDQSYEARTRDLQKEGALRAYIAACKERT